MTKLWKRCLSMFMVVTMVFGMLPVNAFAADVDEQTTETVVTEPVQTQPVETEAPETEAVTTAPAVTETEAEETSAAEPEETEAEETEPAEEETEPEVTELEVTEPVFDEAVQEEFIQEELSVIPSAEDFPSDDELFAVYADSVLYDTEISFFGTAARETLEGNVLLAYDALRPHLEAIARGERDSSVIAVGTPFMNVTVNGVTGDYPVDTEVAFDGNTFTDTDLAKLVDALLADMPYELYWYAKTVSTKSSRLATSTKMRLEFKFPVAANYSASGTAGGYDPDTAKTGAASKAAETAAQVAAVTGKNDYEKLVYFKDYICDATSYNSSAASSGVFKNDNDPWQLIYVFDGDASTNVVCEGYSKAFQYLCDLAEFEDSATRCYSVTGYAGGAHMWNIVTLEGSNYMVDVTNTDLAAQEGYISFGQDGTVFLAGTDGSIATGYTFTNSYGNKLEYLYSYVNSAGEVEQTAIDTWGSGETSILKLASSSYEPDSFDQDDLEAGLAATVDESYIIPESVTLTRDLNLSVPGTEEGVYYSVYLPEGITMTVPSDVTVNVESMLIIQGGTLIVESGAKLNVNFGIMVENSGTDNPVGGTLTIEDGATVNFAQYSGVSLLQDGLSKVNGSVSELFAKSVVTTAQELKTALALPVGSGTDYQSHDIQVTGSFTLEESLEIPALHTLYLYNGVTVNVGSAGAPVVLTNNGVINVSTDAALVVAEGSELANNAYMNNYGGTISGNVTGNTPSDNQTSTNLTEEQFAQDMLDAADSGNSRSYGIHNNLTITGDITIPANVFAFLGDGIELTIAEGGKLTVEGQLYLSNSILTVNGTVTNNGDLGIGDGCGNAKILVNQSGTLVNNSYLDAANGLLNISGSYTAGESSSTVLSVFTQYSGLEPKDIFLSTTVYTEEELRAALTKKEGGYQGQSAYVDPSMDLTSDLTVPEGVYLNLGMSYYPDQPYPQCVFTVKNGVTLTIEGECFVSEHVLLLVESGGSVVNSGMLNGDGFYANTGSMSGNAAQFESLALPQEWFEQSMEDSADGQPYYLRNEVILEENTTISAGGTMTLLEGGRIVVPNGVTLTIDSDVELVGGALIVENGGSLIVNGKLHNKRGTLYIADGAVEDFSNGQIDGYITHEGDTDPYLSTFWAHDFGDGYFMNDEQYGENRAHSMTPGQTFSMVFCLNVFDTNTLCWSQVPLQPELLTAGANVTLTRMDSLDDIHFREGEPSTDCFVDLNLGGKDAWDTVTSVSYPYGDGTLVYEIYVGRDEEMGFYSSETAGNDTWLNEFAVNPMASDNSFYYIITDQTLTITNVEIVSGGDKMTIEYISDYVYKCKVNADTAANIWQEGGFDFVVKAFGTYEDGNAFEREYGIWLNEKWLEDSDIGARFAINDEDYHYVVSGDSFILYTENGPVLTALPEGVTYDYATNTITLTDAQLENMRLHYFSYDENGNLLEGESLLPGRDVTLVLSGESSIVCDYDSALSVGDGVNLNICGDGIVRLKSVNSEGMLNEDGSVRSFDTINLWNESSLTIGGEVAVFAEIAGIAHDGEEQRFLSAVRGGGSNLVLKEKGALVTTLPEGGRRSGDTLINNDGYYGGYAGLEDFASVTVQDEAYLVTSEFYTNTYTQTGGEVNIVSTGSKYWNEAWEWDEETQTNVSLGYMDGYHYDGISVDAGTIDISGGLLMIDLLPTDEEEEVRAYYYGLNTRGGEIRISGGTVDIVGGFNGAAINVSYAENEDGTPGAGGHLSITGGEILFGGPQDANPRFIDVTPQSTADLNGGTLHGQFCEIAFGGVINWKRTEFYGTSMNFRVDQSLTMNSGLISLEENSRLIVNGMANFLGSSALELSNSAMIVNNGTNLAEGTAVTIHVDDDYTVEPFGLLVNTYLAVNDDVTLDIESEFTAEKRFIPVQVNGTFHQMGGHVIVKQSEFGQGPGVLSSGVTLLNDGQMDIYGSTVGFAQGYDFDRPEGEESQLYVSGGVLASGGSIVGILLNGPAVFDGGRVGGFATGETDAANGIWPQGLRVEKYTGNPDGSGDNVTSLTINGGYHYFGAEETTNTEACSKAISIINAPVFFNGGTVDMQAEMVLYSISDTLENTNLNGNCVIRDFDTGEAQTVTSRDFTETEEAGDYFHTILNAEGNYSTYSSLYVEMSADAFEAAMAEAVAQNLPLILAQQVIIDRNVTLQGDVTFITGGYLVVEDGGVLTIPYGAALTVVDMAGIYVYAGGLIDNYGTLTNDRGYINIVQPDGYAHCVGASEYDVEDDDARMIHVLYEDTRLDDTYGIDSAYITLEVNAWNEDIARQYLGSDSNNYCQVHVYYNQSMELTDIYYNATLHFGGNENYIPVLTIAGDPWIDGGLETYYAEVIVDGSPNFYGNGGINLNQTLMTVNGELYIGNGALFINDGSLLKVNGSLFSEGSVHVGFWKEDTTEGPAGVLNIAEGASFTNRLYLNICEGGVVNVNGELLNVYGFSPRSIDEIGDIRGLTEIHGRLNVYNYLGNDIDIRLHGDGVLNVASGGCLENSETGDISGHYELVYPEAAPSAAQVDSAECSTLIQIQEGAMLRNAGVISAGLGTLEINGDYECFDDAVLAVDMQMNGDTGSYAGPEEVPVALRLQFEGAYTENSDGEEVQLPSCDATALKRLIEVVQEDGYQVGLMNVLNAEVYISGELTVPDNIYVRVGMNDYDVQSAIVFDESAIIRFCGSLWIGEYANAYNNGVLVTDGADIRIYGSEFVNEGVLELINTDVNTHLENYGWNVGALRNEGEGTVLINSGSIVHLSYVDNYGYISVGPWDSEQLEGPAAVLNIYGSISNYDAIDVEPTGVLNIISGSLYNQSYSDNLDAIYNVFGQLNLTDSSIQNNSVVNVGYWVLTPGQLNLDATSKFTNSMNAELGVWYGGTLIAEEGSTFDNYGFMDLEDGDFRILGTYTHHDGAIACGFVTVTEDGIQIETIEGVPQANLTLRHLINTDYPLHGKDTMLQIMDLVRSEGYAGTMLVLQEGTLEIDSEFFIPENMILDINTYGRDATPTLVVAENAMLLNQGILNLTYGGTLVVNGNFAQLNKLTMKHNCTITVNGQLSNMGTLIAEAGTVTNNGIMSGPMTIEGKYVHGENALLQVPVYAADDGSVYVDGVVGVALNYQTISHVIHSGAPLHNENTIWGAVNLLNNRPYKGLYLAVHDVPLTLTQDLVLPDTATLTVGNGIVDAVLTLEPGVTLTMANNLENNGRIVLGSGAAIANTGAFSGTGAYEGVSGENLTWRLSEGVLTISGSGDMLNYTSEDVADWKGLAAVTNEIKLLPGITSVGANAFTGCSAQKNVVLPRTVVAMSEDAFDYDVNLMVYHESDAEDLAQSYGYPYGYIHELEGDKCQYCDYSLSGSISNAATTEEKVEQLKNVDTETLKQEMENSSGTTSQLVEELDQEVIAQTGLEVSAGVAADSDTAISDTFADVDGTDVVGAALNASEGVSEVKLVIGDPSGENEISDDYDDTNGILFSMTLEGVRDSENLDAPVKITLPVPENIDPDKLVVLHYHDGVEEVVNHTLSEDKTSVSFVVTGFSDFALAERDEPAASAGNIVDNSRTLSLDGVIYINQYALFEGFEDYVTKDYIAENGGMLIWSESLEEVDAVHGYGTPDDNPGLLPVLMRDGVSYEYMARTDGIAVKEYADEQYLRVYLKLQDGSYVYGPLKEFSVQAYCEGRLANSSNEKLKNLCAAMLHFGAAAQTNFGYNTGDLANANILTDWPVFTYDSSWINLPVAADTSIVPSASVSNNGRTLSLDGAIVINYYFGTTFTPAKAELLIWDGVDGTLTDENYTDVVELTLLSSGEYFAQSREFAAKEYSDVLYACARFTDEEGNIHYSDVSGFSPEAYAQGRIDKSSNAALVETVKRMVTYGEYARIYFG